MKNLAKLNPYILKYKYSYLLGILFLTLANFFSIFVIRYFSSSLNQLKEVVIDNNNADEILSQLFLNAFFFIFFSLISGIFRFYQRQTIIVSSRKIEYDIRNKVFKQYTFLNSSFYKKNKIGDLINRISEDVGNVRMYLGPGIMYIANLLSLFIIISIFMFYADPVLTMVTLLPLPFLSFLIYKVSRVIYKKSKLKQIHQSAVSSYVQDSFSGIRIIKSFVKENYINALYDKKTEDYKSSSLSLAKTEALFFPLMIFIIGLTNILVIYIGGLRYFEGLVDIGTIGAFFLYVNILIFPFISLGFVTSLIQKAEASMARINEFLAEKTEEVYIDSHLDKSITGDIEFKNVSYTYPNTGILAADNISFKIKEGNTLAIFGKTGSGKTTIGMLLARILNPDSGQIFLDGKNINEYPLHILRKSIGYIPQDSFLFSDTILNNLAFGLEDKYEDPQPHEFRNVQNTKSLIDEVEIDTIKKYTHKADVHKNIMEFAQDYSTKVGERGVTLSGGQKQRISIARALIKEAPILLFDDALSAVDTETEDNILNNIKEDINEKTTLIISHRVSSAKNADIILVIENGKIIEQGSFEDLIENKNEFYSLYQKQLLEKDL